jgi:hypothetical protein
MSAITGLKNLDHYGYIRKGIAYLNTAGKCSKIK